MRTPFASLLMIVASAASLPAAVSVTVRDITPNGKPDVPASVGTRSLTTTLGSISAPAALPTLTYTLTNLNLTSVGGGLTDQIVFQVSFSQTGGSAVQFNSFGNVSVTGNGGDFFINTGETLTATVSLISTTFSGGLGNLSIGFDFVNIGGTGSTTPPATPETWDIVHSGGTLSVTTSSNPFPANNAIPLSSSFTIQNVTGPNLQTINLQGYEVEITAVPEPASFSLIGVGALALLRRRRQA